MIPRPDNANSINHIVIVGGGITGWTVAVALAKGLRGLGIELVVIDNPTITPSTITPTDLHCAATTPACVAFHHWLGLDEKKLVAATGASFQLATRFNAWSGPQQNYFMPYSDHGFMLKRIEFPHYAVGRQLQGHEINYDDYSLAAVAAKRGRFCHPSEQASSLFSTLRYGLNLNTHAYTNYLRDLALQLNVQYLAAELDVIQQNHHGDIASLRVKNINPQTKYTGLTPEGIVTADFYIDCTGAEGSLIDKTLQVAWQSLANQLPLTHVLSHTQTVAPAQALPSHRELRTASAGWTHTLSSQTHTEQQYFYHADFTSAEQARRVLGAADNAPVYALDTGRRASFWHKNCLAMGAAAGNVGELAMGNLALVQSAVRRFLSLFPARQPAIFNAAEFNRLTHLEYDHIEDFHILHYHLANQHLAVNERSTYWQHIHTTPRSDRLTYKLELFKQRGLIPVYEGDSFSAGVWASLLLGNDYWPARVNPMIHTMDANWIEQQLASMQKLIRAAADSMPEQTF